MSWIFNSSSSYTTDDTPQTVTIDESAGTMENLIHDNSLPDFNGAEFNFNGGTTHKFEFDYHNQSISGSGGTQADRHWNLYKLKDANGAEIINVGVQYGTHNLVVYDCGVANPGWTNYQGNQHDSGIDASGSHNIEIRWNGSAWVVDIDNGSWTYTNSNYNNPAYTCIVGYTAIGSNQNGLNHQWWTEDKATAPPASPNSVDSTYISDSQIDLSWSADTSGGAISNYDVQILRDGLTWRYPSGGPSSVTTAGTYSYGPSSDNSYESGVGIDSSFRFRVRAENSAGASGWAYSDTVYTSPIPPHNPSVSRPDANTVEFSWTNKSDIVTYINVFWREDTGSGYGAWEKVWDTTDNGTGNTQSTSISTSTTLKFDRNGDTMDEDAQYQFKLKNYSHGRWSSEVFADYGNAGNVYFKDDFESNDFSAWDSIGTLIYSGNGNGNYGVDAPDSGTYWAVVDAIPDDAPHKNLGDLSAETDVLVKAAVAPAGLSSADEGRIEWYDGSSWQTLRTFGWEYEDQGWTQVTASVPDSWLSTDNRVRFGTNSTGAYYGLDSVVVSDILHEYTKPAAPSGLNLDTSIEDEITASWTRSAAFGYSVTFYNNTLDGAENNNLTGGISSRTITGLSDGEKYQFIVRTHLNQYRNGSIDFYPKSDTVTSQATTVLPAPSGFSVSVDGSRFVLDWTTNHDYGSIEVLLSSNGGSSFVTDASLSNTASSHTTSMYDSANSHILKVQAKTEHTSSDSGSISEVIAGSVGRFDGDAVETEAPAQVFTEK